MDSLRLRLDEASLNQSSSGAILGRVHFQFAGVSVPGTGWDDFVVVILSWWVEAVRSPERAMELRFMDGPYFIRLELHASGMVGVECVEDRETELVRVSCEVSIQELRREIVSAARAVLRVCETKEWRTKDTEALAGALGT